MEAASSFTSALFEIFANFILAIAFKKVIATEQKLPSVSTANGTIDALEREPLARALSWLLLYFCNFNFEAWKMWLSTTTISFGSSQEDHSRRLIFVVLVS